jgi:hypothetical protein
MPAKMYGPLWYRLKPAQARDAAAARHMTNFRNGSIYDFRMYAKAPKFQYSVEKVGSSFSVAAK